MTASSENSTARQSDSAEGDAPPLGRLDASWRSDYIESATADERRDLAAGVAVEHVSRCTFCRLLGSHTSGSCTDEEALLVKMGSSCVAILNKYPYASGHFMIMPIRHVAELGALTAEEHDELWAMVQHGTGVLARAYAAEGINIGANLGRAAGAGIPGHVHVHLVPRWSGDTNFMTSVAEVRVVPEALERSWARLRSAW